MHEHKKYLIMTEYNIQDLGYTSWVELYADLVVGDMHNRDAVGLVWEGGDRAELAITLDEIRSMAFLEIYPALPLRVSLEVVRDIVQDEPNIKQRQVLLEFLNKIPTRSQ